jgi:pimeloyl-ACP methyl ester carboxylesterase
MPQLTVAGRALEYLWIGEGSAGAGFPTLVFLHEGLGSIAQWREFPAQVAKATGCRALVYDRYGYGNSDILAGDRAGMDFMHREALESLPEMLARLGIGNPILVGHSDGASIALIHAGAGHPVRGIAAMAPHVFVEEHGLTSIRSLKNEFETTYLPERLDRYHRDARKSFYLWNDAWLEPAFKDWNLEEYLPRIRCPLLAIQGADDEYGSMAQLDALGKQVGGSCELLKLSGCGHAPYRDQPEKVLHAVAGFIGKIIGTSP